MLNPGEAFAETYRLLNEQKLGLPQESWTIVSTALAPDATALSLLEQDVTTPWTASTVKTFTAKLTGKVRTRTFVVSTPYDGTIGVVARQAAGTQVKVSLLANKRTVNAKTSSARALVDLLDGLRRAPVLGARAADGQGHEGDEDDAQPDRLDSSSRAPPSSAAAARGPRRSRRRARPARTPACRASPVSTCRPLKMSALSSPSTSSTRPRSWPSESTTAQPCSISIQLTGSGIRLDAGRRPASTGPCVPTGSVSERTRRMRSAPGICSVVEPREAAAHHAGGDAVAEPARDAEAKHEAVADAERVDGRREERRALELVARPQLDLGEHVATSPGGRFAVIASHCAASVRASGAASGSASVRCSSSSVPSIPWRSRRSSARRNASGPNAPVPRDEEAQRGRRGAAGWRRRAARPRGRAAPARTVSATRISVQFGGSSRSSCTHCQTSLTTQEDTQLNSGPWPEWRSARSSRRSS